MSVTIYSQPSPYQIIVRGVGWQETERFGSLAEAAERLASLDDGPECRHAADDGTGAYLVVYDQGLEINHVLLVGFGWGDVLDGPHASLDSAYLRLDALDS